jgi:hypothetical protein
MISLKIFLVFGSYKKNQERQKVTGDEIPLLAGRIPTTFTWFRLLLPDSGDGGWNPAAMAIFMPVSSEFGLAGFRWKWLESGTNGQIPAKLTEIWHSIVEFQPYLSDSGTNCQILALVGFCPVLSKSGLPDSGNQIQKFRNLQS